MGGQLEDAHELRRHVDDPNWRLIDCRFDLGNPNAGYQQYLDEHLPGAVFADLDKDLAAPRTADSGRHPLPAVADIAATLSRFGIDQDTRVIVYDAANGGMAARAWWLLRWLGHENVALLDGGIANWKSLGLPLESGHCNAEPREFLPTPRPECTIATDELLGGISTVAGFNLWDARDRVRFSGKNEPIDSVAGHIPGARNLPFTESLKADGTFKTPAQLASMWGTRLGEDKSVSWAVMCGSGVTACHLAISGMQAGHREPRLYVGSWSEWIRDSSRPVGLGES